jgi:hypothetical protein
VKLRRCILIAVTIITLSACKKVDPAPEPDDPNRTSAEGWAKEYAIADPADTRRCYIATNAARDYLAALDEAQYRKWFDAQTRDCAGQEMQSEGDGE